MTDSRNVEQKVLDTWDFAEPAGAEDEYVHEEIAANEEALGRGSES